MGREFIAFFIIGAFTLGLMVFVFWILKNTFEKVERQWKKMAEELNLQLEIPQSKWRWITRDYPSMHGEIEGFPVNFYMLIRGSGKHTVLYTGFEIRMKNPHSRTLRLYKEGFFSKVGKAFGGQDIQLGDDAFDKGFIIKSNDERFAQKLLNPQMRDLVLRNRHLFVSEISLISDEGLKYEAVLQIKKDKQREDLVQLLQLTIKLAKRIQELD